MLKINVILSVLLVVLSTGCVHVTKGAWDDADAVGLSTKRLERFKTEMEFKAYLAELHAIARKKDLWWADYKPSSMEQILLAQAETPCDPTEEECDKNPVEEIAVTASYVKTSLQITNNQVVGVDEGDIVKRVGRFLIVLQDGRLFSVDTGYQGSDLALINRVNVYTGDEDGTWYDELLVHENTLVVIGYSYREGATEIAQFTIDSQGVITPGNKYFISSDDYYSGENYSSRLVDGKLMLYTPLNITELYEGDEFYIPMARYWDRYNRYSDWQPLFFVTDIYKPIQPSLTPTMHVVSLCDLDSLQCQSRGVLGPTPRELYVTGDYAYLWLSSDYDDWGFNYDWPDDCEPHVLSGNFMAESAAVYRIALAEDSVTAVHTNGRPYNQFVFHDDGQSLHALLVWEPGDCYVDEEVPLRFVSIPEDAFSANPERMAPYRYARLPSVSGWSLNAQYTADYLIYGIGQGHWLAYYGDDDDEERYRRGDLYVVDIHRPINYFHEHLRHSIERLELIGDNAVAFGYDRDRDFGISTVNLRDQLGAAHTITIPGMLEYEGRSHAFNSLIEDDGSGIMGVPTAKKRDGARWYSYNNNPANVDFFSVSRRLRIQALGALEGDKNKVAEDYECDVSCIDWYGNARPIFMEGRIFALTGSELIEGVWAGNVIDEVNRISLTGKPLF